MPQTFSALAPRLTLTSRVALTSRLTLTSLLALASMTSLAVASLAGCGDGSATDASSSGNAGPPTLAIVYGAPAAPSAEPMTEEHAVEGYARAMGSHGGLIAVGTTTGVYEIEAAGPKLLPIVGDEPDLPKSTGSVSAMTAYGDGLLVASESAVFFTAGGALQLSLGNESLRSLKIVAMSSRIADDDGDGASESHLMIRGEAGAYEGVDGAMSQLITWTIAGEDGPPTAMFSQKDRLFLAYGPRFYEIDKATTDVAYPLPFDIGRVTTIACSSFACDEGSLLYFGSDRGLVERSADGVYKLYPLAAEGGAPVPVDAFALDAQKQRLYALAGGSVLRVRPGAIPDAVATLGAPADPAMSRPMAVDKLGDVWAAEGLSLRRLALGTPLSFATDVRPVMHEYCSECHAAGANGAPKLDFESFDAMETLIKSVLVRVKEGTMPPATYAKKLPKETISILEDWSAEKAP